jgi:hypothetical protein
VQLQEKFRSIFNRPSETPVPARAQSNLSPNLAFLKPARKDIQSTRQSRGLEQFFFNLQGQVGLSILDLAGASQQNIDFLTNLGHKVYSANVGYSMEECFGSDPSGQTNPGRIEYFLRSNFDYPSESFDGVLMWDAMQFMGPALLNATVERLADIMRPKSYLLAFFTVNDKVQEVSSFSFRIQDDKTLMVTDRGMRPTGHVFNNRSLEKLFGKFESVKFFLTRDNLREVIVRR